MVAAHSCSSARSAVNSARICSSACADTTKRRDCASEAIAARTAAASRPLLSNSSRSKLDEIWISIDGEVVATTSRIS